VRTAIAKSARVEQVMAEQSGPAIVDASRRLSECFRRGGKALLFGNGGSASDAQHVTIAYVLCELDLFDATGEAEAGT
jgi:D-sedoheptulose 7-phosphate isomerase